MVQVQVERDQLCAELTQVHQDTRQLLELKSSMSEARDQLQASAVLVRSVLRPADAIEQYKTDMQRLDSLRARAQVRPGGWQQQGERGGRTALWHAGPSDW